MMINHAKSVSKGIKKSVFVVDMPKNSYNNIKNAKRTLKKLSIKLIVMQ